MCSHERLLRPVTFHASIGSPVAVAIGSVKEAADQLETRIVRFPSRFRYFAFSRCDRFADSHLGCHKLPGNTGVNGY
jgi:hypothetical protein